MLRCAAVLLVLFRHLDALPASDSALLRVPLKLLFEAGWMGVDLFFVLSGFLVAGLLFREVQEHGQIHIKRFLIRRGLKIYPGFYVLIGATVGVAILQGWNLPWKRILSEVFFVQNYHQGLWNQTWSLAVEEHFYLLLPLLLLVLLRWNRHKTDPLSAIPYVYAVMAAGLLLLRLMTAWRASFQFVDVGTWCYRHLTPTHLRMDSLMLGVLLSYLHQFHGESLAAWVKHRRAPLCVAALCAFAMTMRWPLMSTPWMYIVGYSIVAAGSGALLLVCVESRFKQGWLVRSSAYVGSHSYSIYLWHGAVGMLAEMILRQRLHLPLWVHHAACLAGSITVGIVMANLVEIPVLRLRDRLFPSRSRALETSEAGTPASLPEDRPPPVAAALGRPNQP